MTDPKDIPDLREIIDSAEPEVLRDFLWKQARKNSALALKLRAHLIEGVESIPGVNKYSQVISLLVRHDVHGTIKLTRRSVQLLRDICQHFVNLQEQYLRDGALREAWEAGYAILSHLHLLMDKYAGPDPKLVSTLTECYRNLLELLRRFPAPELRLNIFESLFGIARRSHHMIYDLNSNSIVCLVAASSGSSDMHQISELVIEKLPRPLLSAEEYNKYWSALLLKIPDPQISLTTYISSDEVYDIAHLLHAVQDGDALARLVKEFAPPVSLTTIQRIQWAKWKFDLALLSGQKVEIQAYGWELLRLDQDINTYRKLKAAAALPFSPTLIGDTLISDELRADILAEEQQWDALAELIRTSNSLSILIRHCEDLFEHLPEPQHLIQEVTHVYAVHYGGPKSGEQVKLLMDALLYLHQRPLAEQIADHLRIEFPGRFDDVLKLKGNRKGQKQAVEFNEE